MVQNEIAVWVGIGSSLLTLIVCALYPQFIAETAFIIVLLPLLLTETVLVACITGVLTFAVAKNLAIHFTSS